MTATVTEITSEVTTEVAEQPKVPAVERVRITVIGVRPSGNITQDLELDRPQGQPSAVSIAYVWERVRTLGGLVSDEGENKAGFYPLESFERVTIEVGVPVGVKLP